MSDGLITTVFFYTVLGKSNLDFRVRRGTLPLSILKGALNFKSTVYISSNSFKEKMSKLSGTKA